MDLLLSFLGHSPRAPPPVEVLSAPSVFRNHPDGRLLVLPVQGHRMAGECWDLQRERVFHFAPETGWPAAFPPTGAALPGQDESGGFRVALHFGGEGIADHAGRVHADSARHAAELATGHLCG